jgi:hypothetical protein
MSSQLATNDAENLPKDSTRSPRYLHAYGLGRHNSRSIVDGRPWAIGDGDVRSAISTPTSPRRRGREPVEQMLCRRGIRWGDRPRECCGPTGAQGAADEACGGPMKQLLTDVMKSVKLATNQTKQAFVAVKRPVVLCVLPLNGPCARRRVWTLRSMISDIRLRVAWC